MPAGVSTAGSSDVAEPLGLLDAGLDLADAGQVLVELAAVLRRRAAAAWRGRRRGRSRGWTAAPAGGVAGSPAARPARRRRRGARRRAAGWAPAASASSASSRRGCTGRRRSSRNRSRRPSGRESQVSSSEGKRVRWPTSPGDHLVDGDAGPDVGGALLQADAGQERAVAAGVVAGAVRARRRPSDGPARRGPGPGSLSGSSGWSVRLELEVGPLAARPPGGRDGAVGEVDERRPQRRARGGRGQAAGPVARRAAGSGRSDANAGSAIDGAEPAEEVAAARGRPGVARRMGRVSRS